MGVALGAKVIVETVAGVGVADSSMEHPIAVNETAVITITTAAAQRGDMPASLHVSACIFLLYKECEFDVPSTIYLQAYRYSNLSVH